MYFNRVWIKENSRARLRAPDHWNAVLIAFLGALLAGTSNGVQFNFQFNYESGSLNFEPFDRFISENFGFLGVDISHPLTLIMILLPILLFSLFVLLCIQIFFSNIVSVGMDGWFMCFARGESPTIGTMFGAFKFYKRALPTTLLVNLYTFLWSLLFLIPGIVKGYAYSMTNYILCDNPNLSPSQAIRMSEELTDGYKGDLFVLELSFFGWDLLSALTFGLLGIFYVNPYYYTARAGAYLSLKQIAIAQGRMSPADFGDFPADNAALESTVQ